MPTTTHIPHAPRLAPLPEPPSWPGLVAIIQQLSLARDLPTIMQIVRTAARHLTGADGATFVLRDGTHCYYADEDAIAPLWKGKRFPMSICISGWVMTHAQTVIIPDIYADPRIPAEAYRPTFVKSLAMVPIRTASPLGAIGAYWATPTTPTDEQVALLAALADTTSVAMENVRVYQELEFRVAERTHELEALNRELDAFSSAVSHDLRSPLTSIQGFAELLQDHLPNDPRAQDFLARITAETHGMERLISALLSLSRITRVPLRTLPVDLSATAEACIDRLRRNDPHHRVAITIQPGLTAHADPALAEILLDNLLSNAWKYSSKNPAPAISFTRDAHSPNRFHITDNGAGFDPDLADRLFTPFHRLHSHDEFPGIGIGLATVHRILLRHQGSISASAVPNQGATFSFTLP